MLILNELKKRKKLKRNINKINKIGKSFKFWARMNLKNSNKTGITIATE
jgi:hypothetical protein